MTKKFISRQTSLPLQPAKSPFSPRPFAPAVQAKAQDDNAPAPLVKHSSKNSNILSRLTFSEPVSESQQIGPEVGMEGPKNQHKIQCKHQDSFPQVSAVPRFLIQAKLTVGTAGDKYEQEADHVARQVINRIQAPQVNLTSSEANPLQRKISIQAFGGEGGEVSSEWEGQLNQARGGGQPLSPSLKEPMEREFGADFSGVRVHTGAQADNLARSIQAKAFTTGQDVFFGQGAYQPGSRGGQELLAHELTHVVQQAGSHSSSVMKSESHIQRLPTEKIKKESHKTPKEKEKSNKFDTQNTKKKSHKSPKPKEKEMAYKVNEESEEDFENFKKEIKLETEHLKKQQQEEIKLLNQKGDLKKSTPDFKELPAKEQDALKQELEGKKEELIIKQKEEMQILNDKEKSSKSQKLNLDKLLSNNSNNNSRNNSNNNSKKNNNENSN